MSGVFHIPLNSALVRPFTAKTYFLILTSILVTSLSAMHSQVAVLVNQDRSVFIYVIYFSVTNVQNGLYSQH